MVKRKETWLNSINGQNHKIRKQESIGKNIKDSKNIKNNNKKEKEKILKESLVGSEISLKKFGIEKESINFEKTTIFHSKESIFHDYILILNSKKYFIIKFGYLSLINL